MTADDETSTPRRPAAWMLCADREVLDVDAVVGRFGQVYRCAISHTELAPDLDAGQPCFLIRTDRSRVIGLWAIGSVVAPCLLLSPDLEHPAAGRAGDLDPDGNQWYAEVELLPVEKPIVLAKLLDHQALAASGLAALSPADGPMPLTPAQVRAIESFDFWIDEPSDEQRAALDSLLDAEDAAAG